MIATFLTIMVILIIVLTKLPSRGSTSSSQKTASENLC